MAISKRSKVMKAKRQQSKPISQNSNIDIDHHESLLREISKDINGLRTRRSQLSNPLITTQTKPISPLLQTAQSTASNQKKTTLNKKADNRSAKISCNPAGSKVSTKKSKPSNQPSKVSNPAENSIGMFDLLEE